MPPCQSLAYTTRILAHSDLTRALSNLEDRTVSAHPYAWREVIDDTTVSKKAAISGQLRGMEEERNQQFYARLRRSWLDLGFDWTKERSKLGRFEPSFFHIWIPNPNPIGYRTGGAFFHRAQSKF